MDKNSNSLIERGQMELISSTAISDDVFRDDEAGVARNEGPTVARQYTAARFFEHHPQQYREIASLRAEGLSVKALARLFSVSRNTISAIDKRETGTSTFAAHRAEAAQSYRHLIRLGCERLEEILLDPDSKLTPRDLSIMIGVLEDKAQLLSGGATQRVELAAAEPAGHASLVEHLKELKEEYDRQQMGSNEGNPPTKAVDGESWLVPAGADPGEPGAPAGADPGGERDT